MERQLLDLEAAYMDDTAAYGNVVRGWEGFLSSKLNHNHKHSAQTSAASAAFGGSGAQSQTGGTTAAGGGAASDAARRSRLPLRDRLFSSSSSTAPLRTAGSGYTNGASGGGGVTSSPSTIGAAAPGSGAVLGGFSLSSGELDLSGGLVGFDSAPPEPTFVNSASNNSYAAQPAVNTSSRRSTGRRGGMDVDDAIG